MPATELSQAVVDSNARIDAEALAAAMEEAAIMELQSGRYDRDIERMMADENHQPRNPLINP